MTVRPHSPHRRCAFYFLWISVCTLSDIVTLFHRNKTDFVAGHTCKFYVRFLCLYDLWAAAAETIETSISFNHCLSRNSDFITWMLCILETYLPTSLCNVATKSPLGILGCRYLFFRPRLSLRHLQPNRFVTHSESEKTPAPVCCDNERRPIEKV